MIRSTILSAAAALALISGVALTSGAAMAQTLTQADVGSFVRDQDGMPIGSLKALDGNQATVWIGFANTSGNHLVTMPANQIATNGGRLVLNDAAAGHYAAR